MTFKKIVLAIVAAFSVVRIWQLYRQKGYQAFPMAFFWFCLGLCFLLFGAYAWQHGVTRGSRGHGIVFWYQDVGAGIVIMLTAVAYSWFHYSRENEPKESPIMKAADWEKLDSALDPRPASPKIKPTNQLERENPASRVLRSYDPDQVNRTTILLQAKAIPFRVVHQAESSGLELWEVWTYQASAAAAKDLLETNERSDSETNLTHRCHECGYHYSVGNPEEGQTTRSHSDVRTNCPKCGAVRATGSFRFI